MPAAALHRLAELLERQADAIEQLDAELLAALVPQIDGVVAQLDHTQRVDPALVAAVEQRRAANERRLEQRLSEIGSRISRIGYGRSALRAYAPAGAAARPFRTVDQGA